MTRLCMWCDKSFTVTRLRPRHCSPECVKAEQDVIPGALASLQRIGAGGGNTMSFRPTPPPTRESHESTAKEDSQ